MSTREVELSGGAPWGFRMHGGADHNQPLRISRQRYSDTIERSLDVNPGRKASLSGIREGDVISSINGRPTRGLTNVEAHAMLRSAGPVLRLGLNEDKEMSPRTRSIGKGTELKRPSQPIPEGNTGRATPQAPVYATIRPSNSSLNKQASSQLRSSLNSLTSDLNSTNLVKSISNNEPPRFHPTNPFYTTLPSNNSSASKLPIPNGKAPLSGLDRSRISNKFRDTSYFNDNGTDLKSPSFFAKSYDSGPSSLPHHFDVGNTNGLDSGFKYTANDKSDIYNSKFSESKSFGNGVDYVTKNPFKTNGQADPFEKYLKPENLRNEKFNCEPNTIKNSHSEGHFSTREEITKITEEKISQVDEVKTVKKFTLNGSSNEHIGHHTRFDNPNDLIKSKTEKSRGKSGYETKVHFDIPTNVESQKYDVRERRKDNKNEHSPILRYNKEAFVSYPTYDTSTEDFISAAEASSEVIASKPSSRSQGVTNIVPEASPTTKREFFLPIS